MSESRVQVIALAAGYHEGRYRARDAEFDVNASDLPELKWVRRIDLPVAQIAQLAPESKAPEKASPAGKSKPAKKTESLDDLG